MTDYKILWGKGFSIVLNAQSNELVFGERGDKLKRWLGREVMAGRYTQHREIDKHNPLISVTVYRRLM